MYDNLDFTIECIIKHPDRSSPLTDYSPNDRKLSIIVESSANEIHGLKKLAEGLYSGRVDIEYISELVKRKDVTNIEAKKFKTTR